MLWAEARRDDPEIPALQMLMERQESGNLMRYDKHPDTGHTLIVFPGLLNTDDLLAANGHLVRHETGHAKERARRREGEPANAEVRRFIATRYGAAGDRLYQIAQPQWGERDFEHYAECYRAVKLGLSERIGPDLASQLLDLGIPLDRPRMEAFFKEVKAVESLDQRIVDFWQDVTEMPSTAPFTVGLFLRWAANLEGVLRRDYARKDDG